MLNPQTMDEHLLAQQPGSTPAPAPVPTPLRVLVVEDDADTAESYAILLRLWGHDVHTVLSGAGAVAAALTYRPDIVLLDIGLPGIDGYQVARHLRGHAGLREPALIAVTGYSHEAERRHGREAGFDLHLVKPVPPEELRVVLTTVAKGRSAASV
jgi:DNA-binding response OmpR family regulator